MINMKNLINFFNTYGYIILRNIISTHEIDNIIKIYDSYFKSIYNIDINQSNNLPPLTCPLETYH